ncbi:glycine oxidase ThiO [Saccharopolyspora sp. CA-218241]|uniref:glycine oxidase ThiO n=1 Tax=Saccharopolyspora sp. CA-218241 TaxID=3240027 RepID=UPI003D98671D
MAEQRSERIAVVGGGVIGLSVAWRLAADGHRIRLIDPAPASGASHVAGGMLAPLAEAWPGEEGLLDLGSASLARWPDFADDLAAAARLPSGLRREGTLVVGVDSADRAELGALADYLAGLGRGVTALTGREARRLEPALGPSVRAALEVPGDLAVDNRATLRALHAAASAAGVEFLAARAEEVRAGQVVLAGSTVDCDAVVLAAGAHSAELHPLLRGRLRPVKGEILRLRARPGALPPPRRTVRGPVRGRQTYLVPRDDGLVLGATQQEVGFDTRVTVGGVRDLIADAERLVPALAEYELAEAVAGLRPGTEDNLPMIGELEPGLVVATGHHRGGFLLAPITADAVVALLRGADPPPQARAADLRRPGGIPCTS